MSPEIPPPLTQNPNVRAAGALTRGLWWTGSGTVITRLLHVALTIVMLQKLSFAELGRWAAAWSVMVVVEAFSGLGVNFAIVRMGDDLSRKVQRSLLTISTLWGFLLAALLLLLAPLISRGYGEPALDRLLVIVALKLILIGPALVPLGLLGRRLGFREIAIAEAIAGTVEALASIVLVVYGFGAVGLVWGTVARAFVLLVVIFCFQPLTPAWRFRFAETKAAVSFGLHVVASNLLYHVYRNVDYFFIGLRLGVAPLGLYRAGFEVGMSPFETATNLVNRVGYPIFSNVQADAATLRATFERTARALLFLLLPIAFFIAIEGRDLFATIAASRWQAAVPIAQILCWGGVLRGVVQLFAPLYQAGGRPRLAIYEAVLTGSLLTIGFAVAVWFAPAGRGIFWAAWSWLLVYPFIFAWDLRQAHRAFGLKARDLFRALGPLWPGSVLMAAGMWLTARFLAPSFQPTARLILVGAIGAALFYFYKTLVLEPRRRRAEEATTSS